MPFCDVDKDVSLYYVTNTPKGDATDLDRTKPTIILLPPLFFDVTRWLKEQFEDPRLSQRYNLIAFDLRNMGSTKAHPCPEHDTWVDAADLAVAHELLQLPPCHMFGVAVNGSGAVLRFATLFPDKCLSLCLCAAPAQAGEDPEWVVRGFIEFTEAYCFPTDMDTLERACMEFSWFAFNGQITTELEDEVIAWLQTNMPPTKRTKFIAQRMSAAQRTRLSDDELKAIQQPTIFIQGDKSLVTPPGKVQETCDKLPDGRIFVINGGPQLLSFIPEYASVVNRIYSQFLGKLSEAKPTVPFEPARPDPCGVCKAGLARLAAFAGDPSIADRDPSTPLSFSRLSATTVTENVATFTKFAKGEAKAFHALDEHGQPKRKFSERHIDDWVPAAFQRMQKQRSSSENGHTGIAVVRTSSISHE